MQLVSNIEPFQGPKKIHMKTFLCGKTINILPVLIAGEIKRILPDPGLEEK